MASSISNATTQLAPLRDHWFAVGARFPQRRSLQQRGLLFVRSGFTPSGLGDSLPLRCVGGLRNHCVILWAVSTFSVRVFIAASGHGVLLWFVQHRWVVIDPGVFLCGLTFLTEIFASCAARFASCYTSLSCHFHTPLPFTCSDDSCLSCLHVGATHGCEFCEISSFFWVEPSFNAFTFATVFLFDLALCLVVSGHASTQMEPFNSLSLSCFKHFWHRFVGCRS